MKINIGDVFINTFIVNEYVYDGFINTFKDKNPLHTSDAYAQKKGFAEKVMHGNILGGFLSFFIGECLPSKDVVIHSQDIKYLKPVYLDDVLQLHVVVNTIHDSVNAVEFKYYFQRTSNDEIVAKGKIQIGLFK